MRILIVDDESPVRSALRLLLEHEPGLTVVGEADTVSSMLAQVRSMLPDLLILDWQLPGLDADELIPYLRELRPGLLIVALDSLPENGKTATRLADKVINKLDPPERVLAALGNCWPRAAGRTYRPCSCRLGSPDVNVRATELQPALVPAPKGPRQRTA